MSGQKQPGLDPGEVKTLTSRKLDWLNGVSIDPEMTPHDFQVAFCIAQCMSIERGIGTIADDTIAESTGTTRRHILESRKRLRARGWLNWENTRTANVYTMVHDLVDAMIDRRTDLRERRAEARFKRLPSRRMAKPASKIEQHVVNPSAQQKCSDVKQTARHVAQSSSQHAVNPSAHIHLQGSTLDIHLKKEGLSKKETLVVEGSGPEQEIATATSFEMSIAPIAAEQPLPPLSEGLAEMKLFDVLGEGDFDRGREIATAIGDARFNYLRSELMRGTLYPSAIRAAARGAGAA